MGWLLYFLLPVHRNVIQLSAKALGFLGLLWRAVSMKLTLELVLLMRGKGCVYETIIKTWDQHRCFYNTES